MKSSASNMILHGALALCLVLSVIFCLQFIFITRESRAINAQLSVINAERFKIQSLLNSCVAYSQKNPAIDPLLKSVGAK